MRRLILAAGLGLAVVVPSSQAQSPRLSHCHKTFTVFMDIRAARAVYAGLRDVSIRERRMLTRIARCQRNPQAVKYVRGINRRHRARWVARRAMPVLTPLAACIVNAETGGEGYGPGGDPYFNDGTYSGVASWDTSAWRMDAALVPGASAYGVAADAPKAVQYRVLLAALAAGRSGQWTPFDPC